MSNIFELFIDVVLILFGLLFLFRAYLGYGYNQQKIIKNKINTKFDIKKWINVFIEPSKASSSDQISAIVIGFVMVIVGIVRLLSIVL